MSPRPAEPCPSSLTTARRWVLTTLAAPVIASSLAGCQRVAFYERQHLQDRIMTFTESPSEVHFYQKSYYSREGSVGGIGSSAGGGCGCY